jgi:5'-3' exonuclease
VNLERAQFILSAIGEVEDEIFKKRQRTELEFRQRAKDKKRRMQGNNGDMPHRMPEWMKSGPYAPTPLGQSFVKPVQIDNKFSALDVSSSQGADAEMTEEEIKRGIKRKHPVEQGQASTSQQDDDSMRSFFFLNNEFCLNNNITI